MFMYKWIIDTAYINIRLILKPKTMNNTVIFMESHRGCKYSFCTGVPKSSSPFVFVVSWYIFSENCPTPAMALLDTTFDPRAGANKMPPSEFSQETTNCLQYKNTTSLFRICSYVGIISTDNKDGKSVIEATSAQQMSEKNAHAKEDNLSPLTF